MSGESNVDVNEAFSFSVDKRSNLGSGESSKAGAGMITGSMLTQAPTSLSYPSTTSMATLPVGYPFDFDSRDPQQQRPSLSHLRMESDSSLGFPRRQQVQHHRTSISIDATGPSADPIINNSSQYRSDAIFPHSAPSFATEHGMAMEWRPSTSRSGSFFESPYENQAYQPYPSPAPSFASPPANGGFTSSRAQQPQQQSSPTISPNPTSSVLHDVWTGSYTTPPPSAAPKNPSTMSRQELEAEITRLRTRVNELEVIHHWAEVKGLRIEEAQTPSQATPGAFKASPTTSDIVVEPILGRLPATDDFIRSWRARTEARIKRFCALNRAGNALCAWHDSRRERRAYPPRQAPPGYLNCGCTNEEALFEESLARNGVGSYHPGEMVRMDPALRNPLLKVLEDRFGYMDGDFERDPRTGLWIEGEGHELWESILPSGRPPVSGNRRRTEEAK